MSKAVFKKSTLNILGKMTIRVGSFLKVLHVEEHTGKEKDMMEINNMTIINLVIKFTGPIHERNLTAILVALQVRQLVIHFKISHCHCFAIFFIKFLLVHLQIRILVMMQYNVTHCGYTLQQNDNNVT